MVKIDRTFYDSLVIPRPVGSENNRHLQERLSGIGAGLEYDVEELPFDCFGWEYGPSCLECGGKRLTVFPSPFSPSVEGSADLLYLDTLEGLRTAQISGKIVVLHGAIAAEPLMPKDFPFFEVPEHREIAALLEADRPLAVLSAMGKHPACGLDPCPMFEDCHFRVPSAYFPATQLQTIMGAGHGRLLIDSQATPTTGKQIVFHKKATSMESAGTVLICAHMDTAHGTPGALDNASGLSVMMKLMELVAGRSSRYDLQFVPFNGEDYADVSGQRAYLARYSDMAALRLVVNIDGVGYGESQNALSTYNLPDGWETQVQEMLGQDAQVKPGEPWFEGDHSMFTMQGVPALALVSSDLHALTAITHTEKDSAEKVEFSQLEYLAAFLCRLLERMDIVAP